MVALCKYYRVNRPCITQFFACVITYFEEYTLIGFLSKFPDNKGSHVLQRKYIGLFIESK